MKFQRTLCVLIILAICSPLSADETPINFKKQIAPIFVEHCLRCHSPGIDKGDLSLDTIEDLKANDYLIAGAPDSSYLMDLVTSHNGEAPAMPKEAEPLSGDHVTLLRKWIQQGATWPDDVVLKEKSKADFSWWSLQPLRQFNDSTELQIDDFIKAKLRKNGLSLSPQADRRTLIRRLSFDLHGLPPTPKEVQEFVNDPDPDAYTKLVDRMLDSQHYGERYAQHWLDLAHYADTHGFERDKRRDSAWRYRDYVINSLNEDKPYDRFLQEQIAGDVLWPEDEQAVIATGFLAAGPWDFVGQVETKSEELRRSARSLDLDDMATQVMTSTMATTINCCRCHDHKLDPITQEEYYQLRAVFAGIKREERVVSDDAMTRYENIKTELTKTLQKIDTEIGKLEGSGLNLADMVGGGNGLGSGTFRKGIDVRSGESQIRNLSGLDNVVTNNFVTTSSEFIDGVFVPDGQDGLAEITVSSTGLTVSGLNKTSGAAWDLIRNGPVASQHSPELGGIDFTKEGHSLLGLHANSGITFDIEAIRKSHNASNLRFTAKVGYFGASGGFRADAWIYLDGNLLAKFSHLGRDQGLQEIDLEIPLHSRFLTLISTDGGNGYGHDQIGFGDPVLKSDESVELSTEDQQRLTDLRLERISTQQQLSSLEAPPKFYGVVTKKDSTPVYLLTRGDSESPSGPPLAPGALKSLSMLDPDLGTLDSAEGERRVALAKWITHSENPLTPRVIVNRLWHWHFGQGIVNTPSDFGFGGDRPSHPELLDWLAMRLQQEGWSLKAMHRLILNSETYKQQSRHNEDANGMMIDADNRLLWRQNSRRLEAEAIRDAVLMVSGCLNLERGGPGFEDFTYQEAYAPIYQYITADEPALFRRSIYRYVVRTTPDRFLTTLDCPDPANLTAKRMTTTTPLQSLALYNNDFMLRQARYFAQRIEAEAGEDVSGQVNRAFELSLCRLPQGQEQQFAISFVKQYGLFALCRSLFNTNEYLYVD
ncbi:DUF1553 domain-containing protein [Rubinisphaera sp.]|uniref:DUF1553 domain-containing protein n=1 Tax=Rubinisphaera sp. TaxID=2024857 RepID=UPI000C0EADF3|nr:DUF1553 domain-containing protein [Rubinisphaera sp.]MBV11773.1 hypothetical protein [Rubinisphaera sp.]|tara:strand:- start:238 stop:3204 length:2967 start_codon:yes stop_codon:yes gene_type:complete